MYEIFEHTADLGIRVRAGDEDELFADAARGLFSVMVANLDAVRPLEEVRIQLVGENLEELLHDWLAELLYHVSRPSGWCWPSSRQRSAGRRRRSRSPPPHAASRSTPAATKSATK